MTNAKPWLRKEQTKLIEVCGEKVHIKKLSYGDAQEIQGSIMKLTDEGKTQLDLARVKILQAVKGVKSWTFTDEHDNTLDISEHVIKEVLSPEVSHEIVEAVNDFNQVGVTEEEKKN